EKDYLYINNKNGTFTEQIEGWASHISQSSMGADMADVNNDGKSDIFTTDMLPENDERLKKTTNFDNYDLFTRKLNLDFFNQYMQNTLQLNDENNKFLEIANFAGVAKTDWSWGALLFDMDNDGYKDIYVCNGIYHDLTNQDFMDFFANDFLQKMVITGKKEDMETIIAKMPSTPIPNYAFKNNKNLTFTNEAENWGLGTPSFSNGAAYGDLDNDGDLDVVTNNLNTVASIYINKTNDKANYLKIRLRFGGKNTFGIGTKVISYNKGKMQYKELQTTRGFQSSSEPIIHFGYGKASSIDSLVVIWPDKTSQTLKKVKTNQTLTIKPNANRKAFDYRKLHPAVLPVFKKVENNLGIDFIHQENDYTDFLAQKLIPYQHSDRGPATAIGDLNGDGKEDLFFGGAKGKKAAIYIQNAAGFTKKPSAVIENDSIYEDASAVIGDFNNDKINDLFVASGGGENPANLDSRLYLNKNNQLSKAAFPILTQNAAVVKAFDYDND
ncbi:hypothetical protein EKL98_15780, partial [Flavobacterium bomense]